MVLGSGLAGDRVIDDLNEATAIDLPINGEVDRAPVQIAVGRVLVRELRHTHLDADSVDIRISDGPHD